MESIDRALMIYGFARIIKDNDWVQVMPLEREIEQLKKFRDSKKLEQAILSLEKMREYDNILKK